MLFSSVSILSTFVPLFISVTFSLFSSVSLSVCLSLGFGFYLSVFLYCFFSLDEILKSGLTEASDDKDVAKNALLNRRITEETKTSSLEAFPVDDSRTTLIILLHGDPHLLKGGKGSDEGATDPGRVLPLWRSDDLDVNSRGSQGGDLLLQAVGPTGEQGGATGEDHIGVEILMDVDVAPLDTFHDGQIDTESF